MIDCTNVQDLISAYHKSKKCMDRSSTTEFLLGTEEICRFVITVPTFGRNCLRLERASLCSTYWTVPTEEHLLICRQTATK